MDNMFKGFGIKGFRSFTGDAISPVGPFENVHIITGQNNSGKSALLDFGCRFVSNLRERSRVSNVELFQKEDLPLNAKSAAEHVMTISLCFSKQKLIERATKHTLNPMQDPSKELNRLLNHEAYLRGSNNAIWIDFETKYSLSKTTPIQLKPVFNQYTTINQKPNLYSLIRSFSSTHGSEELNYELLINAITPWESIPETIKIEAIRDIHPSNSYKSGTVIDSGNGLPNALLTLRNPEVADQRRAKERYERFIQFVQDVMNDPQADVLVSWDSLTVSVKTNDTDYLPLSDLGTGLKELIILAAVIACNSNKLICIEEPEIHLHPALQARFIDYIRQDTDNRFLLTTHSPTIINSPNTTITHVVKIDGISKARNLNNVLGIKTALDDLGVHASDLLQSNYIIWVEGPSDRIYINDWIRRTDEKLVEGVHYSVVFYGGKLLSSINAGTDEPENDLVSLFRVNTHFCVIMDSDRAKPRSRINDTKKRIINECETIGALSWVTDGRTIENYISESVLRKALNKLYPDKKYNHELGNKFICPLSFTFNKSKTRPDKIKIAKEISLMPYEMSKELKRRINKLCVEIRRANNTLLDDTNKQS